MKQYQGSVIVIKDDNIIGNYPFVTGEEAELHFLCECKKMLSNFDEYTKEDIDIILENGYEGYGNGFIAINWF